MIFILLFVLATLSSSMTLDVLITSPSCYNVSTTRLLDTACKIPVGYTTLYISSSINKTRLEWTPLCTNHQCSIQPINAIRYQQRVFAGVDTCSTNQYMFFNDESPPGITAASYFRGGHPDYTCWPLHNSTTHYLATSIHS